MELRAGASDTEEDVIVESGERQLGVDSTSLGQHVRDDGLSDVGQLVGCQPVQQAGCVTPSHFQLPGRREIYDASLLHHHSTFTFHRLKPASSANLRPYYYYYYYYYYLI